MPLDFYGKLAFESYFSHRSIAMQIVEVCTPEQVAAMPDDLFSAAARDDDYKLAERMVQKGYEMTSSPSQIILHRRDGAYGRVIEDILGNGIRFDPEDYASLNACILRGATRLGIKMLDLGMDFDAFREQVRGQSELTGTETYTALEKHWEDMHCMEPEQGQSM